MEEKFENKLKDIEQFETKTHNLEKAVKQQQAKIDNLKVDIESLEIGNKITKCSTTSLKGLKRYMKRKHPVKIVTIYL